jgi:hypothetical protein
MNPRGNTHGYKISLVNVAMGVLFSKMSVAASSTGHIVNNLVVVKITIACCCNKDTPWIGNNSTQ